MSEKLDKRPVSDTEKEGNRELTPAEVVEHLSKLNEEQKIAQRHRRVFYWVMCGALNSDDFGFEVNPNEWWHWSYGDQLWAQMRRAPCAFFGEPEL